MKSYVIKAACIGSLLSGCTTLPEQNKSEPSASSASIPQVKPDNRSGQVGTPTVLIYDDPVTAEISTKYERIKYGQNLGFVCTNPVLAEGHLNDRPNLQIMWENYLYDRPEGIWGEIGGKVEVNGNLPLDKGRWTNACTVRLSHMLNQAGHKIPDDGSKTVSGGNKDQYYYRLRDLEDYLTAAFGKPEVAITDGSADSFALPARPGLLLMDFPGSTFFGHTTIWNGASSVDNADIGGHRVLFWDLPCFMPEDRKAQTAAKQTPPP